MIAIDTNVLLRYLLWDDKTQAAKADNRQTVWRALNDYRQAKPVKTGNKKKEADFADALIVNKAKFYTMEKGEALNGVYTFDLAAQIIPGTAGP